MPLSRVDCYSGIRTVHLIVTKRQFRKNYFPITVNGDQK